MEICKQKKCTGCMACFNKCPFGAITIKTDENGFYIPCVDDTVCKQCRICINVCPQNSNISTPFLYKDVYAAWSKNDELRLNSTSGGVFIGIAKSVINQGGSVFGVAFDNSYRAVHVEVNDIKDLHILQGSKYVQSFIGNVYIRVKELLANEKLVLFSGTPCQVAALKSFLGKEYSKLLTIDIVCHGVPSPVFFDKYLNNISQHRKDNINSISFRNKDDSWSLFLMKIVYSSGEIYKKNAVTDPYLIAFFNDFCLRESCYECIYPGKKRVGDITLGDFWGYISYDYKFRNTEKGINLVIVNTDKGKEFLQLLKQDYIFIDKNIEEAIRSNGPLTKPTKLNPARKAFFYDLQEKGFVYCKNKYLFPRKYSRIWLLGMWINDHTFLIGKYGRKLYERMRKVLDRVRG